MADDPYAGVLHHVRAQWDGLLGTPEPEKPSDPAFLDYMRSQQSAPSWEPLADKVGSAYGVPSDVARALVLAESNGDPQFKTAGGKVVGLGGEPAHSFLPGEDPMDPETNLRRAFSRLAYNYAQTGDWTKAALRRYGAATPDGSPSFLGGGADGYKYQQAFEAARRRYQGGA